MADEGFDVQVRHAVKMAAGDPQLAVRLLTNLVIQDPDMMRAAVGPFLQGILFSAVQKAMSGVSPTAGAPAPAVAKPVAANPAAPKPNGKPRTVADALGLAAPPPRAAGRPAAGRQAARPKDIPPEAMNALIDKLGADIPVAQPKHASGRPMTPEEVLARIGRGPDDYPPPKAGASHQSAIKAMAKSFKNFQR